MSCSGPLPFLRTKSSKKGRKRKIEQDLKSILS
jgi:hypothetical protein